jgi:signal peptidase I
MRRRTKVDGIELRFWLGLIALFVVISVVYLWLWVVMPAALMRGHAVVVTSGSMGPVIRTGDVLVLAPHDGAPLAPGAVVTFRDPSGRGLITHRIVRVNDDGTYRTRGDANASVDAAALRPERIVGNARVLVPLIGLPRAWMTAGDTLPALAWLASLVMAAWFARYGLLRRYDPWQAVRPVPSARDWDLRRVRRVLPRQAPVAQSWSVGLWEIQPAMGRTLLAAGMAAHGGGTPADTPASRSLADAVSR